MSTADPVAAAHRPGEPPGSVDPAEAAFYTRLADTWWDQDGPFWPLHRLNGLRTGFIRRQLCEALGRDMAERAPLSGLEVLDIGCGGGILSEAIAALGATVHGVDVVERNIAVAREHARRRGNGVRYEVSSAEALREAGQRYDVVLNMEVVEHVADVQGFMDACAALVKPGGIMFVATINRTVRSFLFAIIGAEYVLRWLPRGTHRWRRFPTPRELEHRLNGAGLTVRDRRGVRVNPLTRSFSLCDSLAVNYMLVAHRPPPDITT